MMPYTAKLLIVLFTVSGEGWPRARGELQFSLVPAGIQTIGKGQLANLQSEASKETFLDRLLGTNCFSESVREISNDCKTMDQSQKSRLALKLVNCQLATQGDATHPCGNVQPLRHCTDALPDRAYQLYVEFLSHADNMCLFIQNQDFEKYTETMLNRLADGTAYAKIQLVALGEQAAEQHAHITRHARETAAKVDESLQLGKEQRDVQQQVLETARRHREESLAYFASLSERSREMLELQEEAYLRQQELQKGQDGMTRMLSHGSRQVESLFSFIDQRAQEHLQLQQQHEEQQRQLTTDLRGLALDTQGLRSAVDVVVRYEQRSDAALIKLLGRSYTLEDAAFYGVGLLGVLGAGLVPGGGRARLPMLALLCSGLVGERMLLAKLHMSLERDPADELVVYVPPPLMALTAAVGLGSPDPLPLNVKWTLRKALAGLAALAALYAVRSHRNYERDSYNAISRLEKEARASNTAHLEHLARIEQRLAAIHAWEQQRLLALQAEAPSGGSGRRYKEKGSTPSGELAGLLLPPGGLEGYECGGKGGWVDGAGTAGCAAREEGAWEDQGRQQDLVGKQGRGAVKPSGGRAGREGPPQQQPTAVRLDGDAWRTAGEGPQPRTPAATPGHAASRGRGRGLQRQTEAGERVQGGEGKLDKRGGQMVKSDGNKEGGGPQLAKRGKRGGEAANASSALKASKRAKR